MNFDRVAKIYTILEKVVFGNQLQWARTCQLDKIRGRQSILLIGEGRGRLFTELIKTNTGAIITLVESSEAMLSEIKNSIPSYNLSNHNFINLSFEDFKSFHKYDAVCTCFFWDCFEIKKIKSGLRKMHKMMESDAVWLNSDFSINSQTSVFYLCLHKVMIRFLYHFFKLNCEIEANKLQDILLLGEDSGFRLQSRRWHPTLPISSEFFVSE
ncbi:class I SAM-dependent methyltransferase [Opitutales bacterium]|nr:class I SAM-dependent methyltransferase [Opitutales bacterium]